MYQAIEFPTIEQTMAKYSSFAESKWMKQNCSLVDFKIKPLNPEISALLLTQLSSQQSKALGTMIGAAVGDALGAHFEGMTYREKSKLVQGWDDIAPKRFYLGLYTDDTALSLCIADSLILNKLQYDPLDIRHRFVLWWICGYNNGFSKSPSKISMGIGSSTAKSFLHFLSQPTSYVLEEPNFAQQISGNGSIMRMAPFVVAFNNDKKQGLEISKKQSYITHNGIEAAESCMLLFYVCQKLWNSKDQTLSQVLDALVSDQEIITLLETGVKFIAQSKKEPDLAKYLGNPRYCQDEKDRNWDWRDKQFSFSPTRLKHCGNLIGLYALDCLAMALHLVYHYSFKEAIFLAAGRGGDADSIAAIVGMLFGSYQGLTQDLLNLYSPKMTFWDDFLISQRALELLL